VEAAAVADEENGAVGDSGRVELEADIKGE